MNSRVKSLKLKVESDESVSSFNFRLLTFNWILLIPLLLLTFWLGARGLNIDPIWGDERLSIFDAGGWPYEPRTPADIWVGVTNRNPWHAPGFFIILSFWGRIVGWQPPVLRLLPLLFGVLAVAWTYRLGRDWTRSPLVGLVGAATVGVSAFFVHYLHELRMYTLFALLTAFSLWVYWRIIHPPKAIAGTLNLTPLQTQTRSQNPIWLYLGLLAGAVSMLYTHYFAALPLFAIGLYHLLFAPKNKRWWQVVFVMLVAGLIFLPWFNSLLLGIGRAASDQAGYVRARAATLPETIQRVSYLFSNDNLILLGGAVVLALLAWKQRGARQIWFFALSIFALILLVNSYFRIMTLTRMRYTLGLWPLLGLVVGLGVMYLTKRWRWAAPLFLGAWLIFGISASANRGFISGLFVDGRSYIFPWNRVREDFLEHAQPGDALVINVPEERGSLASGNQTIATYYLSESFVRVTVADWMLDERQQDAVYDTALDFAGQSSRVWVAYEANQRPSDLPRFEGRLSENYDVCPLGLNISTVRFDLYTQSPVCCLPADDAPVLIQYDEGISVTGLDPLPETADTLPVLLGWKIDDAVPPYQYSVALHVLDEQDNLVAQADYGLPEIAFSCQRAEIALENLPPGHYSLHLIIYAWESGERLTGEVVETGVTGDRLLLGEFEKF
jgi:hypothetical protein